MNQLEAERRAVWWAARNGWLLDREFKPVTDCRYGHVGLHYLTGVFNDQWTGRRRVHRECAAEEECPWRAWSEWA